MSSNQMTRKKVDKVITFLTEARVTEDYGHYLLHIKLTFTISAIAQSVQRKTVYLEVVGSNLWLAVYS